MKLTKAALKVRCQQIMSAGPGRVGAEDALFLLTDVFPRHESWSEKRGPGVSHVEVRVHGEYRSKGFFLVRTDGSSADISYRMALEGASVSARVKNAAREEVFGQISEWKRANRAPADGMHADHVMPFDVLFSDWLVVVGLGLDEIVVTSQLVGHRDLFASRDLALSWQRYHREHARLQWLTAAENIAKSNRVEHSTPAEHDEWLQDYAAAETKLAKA